MQMILSATLFLLGVTCYSIRDLKSFGKLKWSKETKAWSRPSFWSDLSYQRKYKTTTTYRDFADAPNNWYYRFFKIKHKERFPLSATLLVFLTDGFHLMQWAFKLLFCAAFYPLTNWWFPVILWVLFGATFTLCDKYLTK